jgi:MFS family permease
MGLYAFFLAGSNYFAPVICGFIAEYQGWRWVFYWPSIFAGFAIIFLFFFCEETNYVREYVEQPATVVRTDSSTVSENSGEHEKSVPDADSEAAEAGTVYTKKSYAKKLSLLGPRQKQNTMFRRLWQIMYYLSWPVIFYAGYVLVLSWCGFWLIWNQLLIRILSDSFQYPQWNRVDHSRWSAL